LKIITGVIKVILGYSITLPNDKVKATLYTEYHACDECGKEYRLCYKSNDKDNRLLRKIADRLGSQGKDLCFACRYGITEEQAVLPI